MEAFVQVPAFLIQPLLHPWIEALAMSIGVLLYRYSMPRGDSVLGRHFPIVVGAMFGAGLGNKAAYWVQHFPEAGVLLSDPARFFMGQSIVGGLIGGWLGVELAKWIKGIRYSTGDRFVLPLLAAMLVGRIGCFMAGLLDETHGSPSLLPWAMDFGDGVPRHPVRLYEILFLCVLIGLFFRYRKVLAIMPGLAFRLLIIFYVSWRLGVDFLKPAPFYMLGLSGIQWICFGFLLLYCPATISGINRFLRESKQRHHFSGVK